MSRPAGGTEERPELRPWNPSEAGLTQFPITCYQPIYFVADRLVILRVDPTGGKGYGIWLDFVFGVVFVLFSLQDGKEKMRFYCENLKRPFHARYNPLTR